MRTKNYAAPARMLVWAGCAVLAAAQCEKREILREIVKETTIRDSLITLPDTAPPPAPRITAFGFRAENNPLALSGDIACGVSENAISGRIPHVAPHLRLVADFAVTGAGARVFADGREQVSGRDTLDFAAPVEYEVTDSAGQTQRYVVSISVFTGLPVIFINTEGDAPIVSKDVYVNASIKVVENSVVTFNEPTRIKGRGNTTWGAPKKPYKMKFDSKVSLLGMPKDKEWVLLANYYDKTALRTEAAFFMGRLSEYLAWTPRTRYVEVFLNERYNGTYQLCEQIKIASDRVNVTDEGYLMEIDQLSRLDVGDVYFNTPRGHLFCIKDPDVADGSPRYNWIRDYVSGVENALYSHNFDEETGYPSLIDVPSFVDWILINEITKNNDAVMFSSCYAHIAPNGKLHMGPLWDFDIALGNIDYNGNESPDGLWVVRADWFAQLMQDPAFVERIRERLGYFKARKNEIFNNINTNAAYLKWSVVENNNKWATFYTPTWPNYAIWGAYDNEVQYLKNWLDRRFEWLEGAFAGMQQ